jgi:digeranylgeranylglycerophospholipid reductase
MNVDEKYDVVVVGSGPAGASTAKKCAEEGLSTLMLDRNQEIGTPVRCGEGLSNNAVKTLKLKMPGRCIAQTIKDAIVYAPNGKRIQIKFKGTNGYIIERKIFDKWLASEAASAGAKVVAKSEVHDVTMNGSFVTGVKANILGKHRTIGARTVVAADGVESLIMRKAGFRAKNPRLVDSGYEYEMAGIDLEDPHTIILYFGYNIAPRGYIWIFPKGGDIANVGVGISGLGYEKTAKQYLDEFILKNNELNKGSVIEVKGGCIPVGGFLGNMVSDGLLGVGDAVNQVNPIHGGGIAESMKAGRIAASVIANAKKKNDFSAKTLSEYNKIWWKECGQRLKNVEKVRELFEKMNDDEMNDLAEVLQGEDLVNLAHGKNYARVAKIYLKFKAKGIKRKIGF